MIGRGPGRIAARLLCAAASAALASVAVAQAVPQQQPPPPDAELDPNAPLAPMPDIGVEWPDLEARETAPASPKPGGPAVATPAGDIRYSFAVEGLERAFGGGRFAYRVQGAVGAGGRPQEDCQCRADRPPFARRRRSPCRIAAQPGLLRCRGRNAHFDQHGSAVGRARGRARRTISFLIGRASRPRGRRAGSRAASPDLRGQAGRPGHCRTGHRRWSRIDDCARRTRFCRGQGRRAGHRDRPPLRTPPP